jgi:2-(1,2-epoxy-1,2-dihydrophenyl)acetyl-CoA isomerase
MSKALEYARMFSNGPTRAFAAVKQIYNSPTGTLKEQLDIEARNQGELADSDDFAEGVAAFLGKRPALFKGR